MPNRSVLDKRGCSVIPLVDSEVEALRLKAGHGPKLCSKCKEHPRLPYTCHCRTCFNKYRRDRWNGIYVNQNKQQDGLSDLVDGFGYRPKERNAKN